MQFNYAWVRSSYNYIDNWQYVLMDQYSTLFHIQLKMYVI